MRPINWPQATLEPTQGARLIEASWADYDLTLEDLGQRLGRKWYDKFGSGEIERFMGWCKTWEEWDEINVREYEDWGFQFHIMLKNDQGMNVWSRVMDTGSDVMGSDYWDSEEVISTHILSTLERLIMGLWEKEWKISLWHSDPTSEMQVQKFGEGRCYYA